MGRCVFQKCRSAPPCVLCRAVLRVGCVVPFAALFSLALKADTDARIEKRAAAAREKRQREREMPGGPNRGRSCKASTFALSQLFAGLSPVCHSVGLFWVGLSAISDVDCIDGSSLHITHRIACCHSVYLITIHLSSRTQREDAVRLLSDPIIILVQHLFSFLDGFSRSEFRLPRHTLAFCSSDNHRSCSHSHRIAPTLGSTDIGSILLHR